MNELSGKYLDDLLLEMLQFQPGDILLSAIWQLWSNEHLQLTFQQAFALNTTFDG